MKRFLVLAIGVLALSSSLAQAGTANFGFSARVTPIGWGCGHLCGGPFDVGPWYSYWPLEAHFQTPAMPQYPFWGPPQTMAPGGGMYGGMGAQMAPWGGGMVPGAGFGGMQNPYGGMMGGGYGHFGHGK
jgi:hypothetical protein